MNQLSIYGVVSNWCEQCDLTEEEQGPKGALTSVKPHEVNLSVSSPRLASGSSLRENIQDFESLSETIRFTRICEDAIFVHQVPAGMSCKTRPDEDDGLGQKAEESEPCLAKSKTSIQETGADTLSVLPAKRPCSHTEPFVRPKGSGTSFLPTHRTEELCQQRSPKWLRDWCVVTIKMKENLTQRCIGTR